MVKNLTTGLYKSLGYSMWKISFPYMTKGFMYVGSKSDASVQAQKIKKAQKWPYAPKITEIKL